MAAKRGNTNTRKYDVSVLARVCMHIRNGSSKTDAFKRVGIHPDTGFAWLRRSREGDDELLVRFERVLERAVAQFNARQLEMINASAQSGAPNTWQAAAWLLERRDPDNWGRRDKTTIEAGDKPLLQINAVILADRETRESARALLGRVTSLGTHEPLGLGMGSELEEDDEGRAESVVVDSRASR